MPEKDYLALAKQRITRPSQMKKKPKLLVYARNKKGKTTLTASAGRGKILILDPEQGTSESKRVDPDVWPIYRWEDVADACGFLATMKHNYEWVGVDGLTRLNDMALDYTMKIREARQIDAQPGMVAQKDWGQAGKVMKTMMVNLYNLPIGVIYTAQERVMESISSEADEDVEEQPMAFVADLPKGSRSMIYSLVDLIGRLYVVQIDKPDGSKVKERRLWIGENPMYDTGYRSDFDLPDYIRRPTLGRITEIMEKGRIERRRPAASQ